jgi:hypothetical protein
VLAPCKSQSHPKLGVAPAIAAVEEGETVTIEPAKPAPSEIQIEAQLAYLSATSLLESDAEILEPPPATAEALPLVGPPAPPAAAGSYELEGQVLLGLSFALFSDDVRVLLPWGPNTSGILASALFLAAVAMLYQPLSTLVDDIRRQTPGSGDRLQRAAGLISIGGGLALALVSIAGSAAAPAVTAENVRQLVLDWSDGSGFRAQPEPADSSYHFSYTMTLDSGFPVSVRRTRVRSDALTFASTLRLSADHRRAFTGMSGGQQQAFRQALEAELDGAGVEIRLQIPEAIEVQQTVPLSELSRPVFHQAVLDMDAALSAARSAVQRQAGG